MTYNSLNRINKILNKFLEPFDCIALCSSDFAYYSGENTITYALVTPDTESNSFLHFAESLHPLVHADIFLWSFLHELGHCETEDDFDDTDEEMYRSRLTQNITSEEYYNLPQEYAATDWAGEYMETHEAEVTQLWKDLAPAIKDFYIEMEVEI